MIRLVIVAAFMLQAGEVAAHDFKTLDELMAGWGIRLAPFSVVTM
jgi:hypothetical protein